MARHRFLLAAAFLGLAAATPLTAQQRAQDWQYKWYWGVKAGVMGYELPANGRNGAPSFGVDWLITQSRVALYLGYAQTFTEEQDVFLVPALGGTQTVAFDGYRQIQANVVVFLTSGSLQPYVGGGFALVTLTNARDPANPNDPTINTAIDEAASGAFIQLMGGAQFRFGKKAALYGQYSYTPQGGDFLLGSGGHAIEAGIRYAFLGSRENDPSIRR